MNSPIQSHKELIVWQKSVQLAVEVYKLTDYFPQRELYGLTSQMRRAAVSIPSNVAEGRNRGTAKDFSHFLRVSFGSASELDTQVMISKKLSLCEQKHYSQVDALLIEVSKMLHAMIKKLG